MTRFPYAVIVKRISVFLMVCGFAFAAKAQETPRDDNPYILFTGLVLTSDSLRAIPYVTIKSSRRGLIGYTDYAGHFDIIVKKGDTIYFKQLEKVGSWHIVPDTLSGNRYYVVKLMVQDTIDLPVIVIHPMPPKALFDNTFLDRVPDDALTIAQRNLENEKLKDDIKLKPSDAKQSQMLLAQTRASQLYYYKQAPPQNYLSPLAWMQFIEAWKRGDYKKKKSK